MLSIQEIETALNEQLSEEKKQEINNLEEASLMRVRTNLTGKKFNRLLVLGRAPSIRTGSNMVSQWWCICSCPEHTILPIRVNNLTSGNSKSCGCLNQEKATERIKLAGHNCALNLTNKKFGQLIALEPTEERRSNSVVWKCQCEQCGEINYVSASELNRTKIFLCKQNYDSIGVYTIKQLLQEANIPYTTEKTFSDCRFPDSHAVARFDFYVDNRYLIEYDGEQHFRECDTNYFRDSLEKRKQHDEFKTKWCQEHNIPLIRIDYTQVDGLTLQQLMLK